MKNKAFKLALTIVIVGALVFGASFARAQTTTEDMIKMLQSLIQMLLQMVAQLQAQLAQKLTTTTTIPTSPSVAFCLDWDFFKDPKKYDDGQSHEEIKVIQEKLGVTPVGGHYGPLTKAAIDKFNEEQKIYNEETTRWISLGVEIPRINGWTISKFNNLYCSLPKPKVTITLINYPPSKTNKMPEGNDIYTYIIPNPEDFAHKIKIEPSGTNITVKTIEIPYSGSIGIYPALSPTSLLYDNDTLVFKLENNKITYDLTTSIYKPYNNIQYTYTGAGDFTWHGIKEDHNIKFEFSK